MNQMNGEMGHKCSLSRNGGKGDEGLRGAREGWGCDELVDMK